MANALWAAMVDADSVVAEESGNQLQISNSEMGALNNQHLGEVKALHDLLV